MAAPFNNLRSKNDRAICAYLIKQGCGSIDDVLPAKKSISKEFPNTVVHSISSKPEENYTGNRRVRTWIHFRGQAVPDDNDESRIEFDQRVGQTTDQMMQTEDGITLKYTAQQITIAGRALAVDQTNGVDPEAKAFAAQNADMADYTCLDIYEAGEGDASTDTDSEGTSWHEVVMFDVICCPSAVN